MKIIVTHLSPDLDAITSSWLLKRYRPKWEDASLTFIPAGTTLDHKPADSDPNIAHVDTGLGLFDHHQFKDDTQSATRRVFDYLTQENHIPSSEKEALSRIVHHVSMIDNFKEAFFHDPTSDIYEFSLHQIIGGLKGTGMKDVELVEFGYKILDGLRIVFRTKIKAEKEVKSGFVFESKLGRTLALESSNEEAVKLALKSGFQTVIRKDPKEGFIRIKTFPAPELDLTPVYEKVKTADPQATWFLHVSLHMLLNGSSKNPDSIPSKLSLQEVIEIIKKI